MTINPCHVQSVSSHLFPVWVAGVTVEQEFHSWSWLLYLLLLVYVISHCLKQALPVDVQLISLILIRVGWHARRTTENIFVKLWNWRFPGIKLPWIDVFDVRHSEEEAVLSFVITNSLISLDPFFMMVMLNRFHFFLKLTVLRDNYWIQRFDPQKGGQYGLRRLYKCLALRGHMYRTLPNWISFLFSFSPWQSNIHNANPRLWTEFGAQFT